MSKQLYYRNEFVGFLAVFCLLAYCGKDDSPQAAIQKPFYISQEKILQQFPSVETTFLPQKHQNSFHPFPQAPKAGNTSIATSSDYPLSISMMQRLNPIQLIARSLAAIENRFDKEKYEAFKIEAEAADGGIAEYQKALKTASFKAEMRRLGLIRFLKRTFQVLNVNPADFSVANSLLCSFFETITPQAGYRLIVFAGKMGDRMIDFISDSTNFTNTWRFLKTNHSLTGLPLSYHAPEGYWQSIKSPMTRVDSVLERVLVKYSVNIYDAAVWQIALTMIDPLASYDVDRQTRRLLSGASGDLRDLRGDGEIFKYGERKKVLDKNSAYFFRIISDEYIQSDPLGDNEVEGFPNLKTVHHEDWKPITGEQAWAAIMGPLQVAYKKYQGHIPIDCPEMRLALSILPAVQAMSSHIGAIYHAPEGTHGKNPNDISNENNFSMRAALNMLYQVLKDKDAKDAVAVKSLLHHQDLYFQQYAFDRKNEVFYQGGFYADGIFTPTRIFAADCQTWAIISLGVDWIDRHFGEGAAYRVWKNTVRRTGYYDHQMILRGIGFTDDHRVLSVEWTCGAILATRLMTDAYKDTHPDWSKQCRQDAQTMRQGIETCTVMLPDGSKAYLYANRRYFIPFGWWANPIPSLVSSAWVILTDLFFNPFELGGGRSYHPLHS